MLFPTAKACRTSESSTQSPEQMHLCLDTSSFSAAHSKPTGDDGPSWPSRQGGGEAVAADPEVELVWGDWADGGSISQEAH